MTDTARQTGPYLAPTVQRLGTFRQLTRVGFNGMSDGFVLGDSPDGPTGCDIGAEDGLAGPCSR
jgi:hypothetical protein